MLRTRTRTKMLWVACLFFLALGFLCAGTSAVYAAGDDENFVGGIGFIAPEFEGDGAEQSGKIKMKARIAEKLSKRSTKTLPQRAMKDAATETGLARATLFTVEPVITDIAVSDASLPYTGGDITVTVTGSNMTGDNDTYTVDPFYNEQWIYIDFNLTGDENTRTARVTLPANETGIAREYTLMVWSHASNSYFSVTATVTVAANPTPPQVDRITVDNSTLGETGGEVLVTVDGRNLTGDYYVYLLHSNGTIVNGTSLPAGGTDEQRRATIYVPANDMGTAQTYTLKVWNYGTDAYFSPTATVTVDASQNPATVTGITADPSEVEYTGGTTDVTVTGSNMTGSYSVLLLDANGGMVPPSVTLVGNQDELTATFPNIPQNMSGTPVEYTLRVYSDSSGEYFTPTATVTVAANPNPAAVDSITVDKSALDHNGGDVEVTVTGSNMTGYYCVELYHGAMWLKDFALTGDAALRSATASIPANETGEAQTYTLKVWSNELNSYFDATTTVTVAANPNPPRVDSITVTPPSLPFEGGEITVTVAGSNMTGSYGVFLLSNGLAVNGAPLDGDAETQMATLNLPPNEMGEAQVYTLRVQSMTTGATFDATATVTVAANPDGAMVDSITASPPELPQEGGEITVTVAGSNMTGSYGVLLLNNGQSVNSVPLNGDAETQRATLSLPPNATGETREYTLRVVTASGAFFSATTTVTVAANPSGPAVDSITATPPSLTHEGGNVTVTVEGSKMTGEYVVGLFYDEVYQREFNLTGDANSRTATATLPANDTEAARQYTLKVYSYDLNTVFAATTTVTVTAKQETPAEVTGIVASPSELPANGGNVDVTVTGSNLLDGYSVDLLRGTEQVGTFTLAGDATTQSATVAIPANSAETPVSYTLRVYNPATAEYFDAVATVTVGARDPNPTPVPVDKDAEPGENDAVDQTITLKDTNGNVLKVEDIPTTPANEAANAKLAEMGLEATVDESGQIHLTGTANDIGEVTLTVTVIGADGKPTETTVTIKVNPVYHTEGPAVDDAPTDWTGTLQNAEDGAGYLFTLYIPLDLTTTEDGKLKEVSADVTGASNLGIEIADDVDESRENSDAARSENIVRRYARLTGTTTDPDEVLIKSVTYRIGIHMHTQTVDVRLTDTAVEDETPDGHYGSNGCNSGAAFGISLALLALLRLHPRRRK